MGRDRAGGDAGNIGTIVSMRAAVYGRNEFR
jgi:hypothetical protein